MSCHPDHANDREREREREHVFAHILALGDEDRGNALGLTAAFGRVLMGQPWEGMPMHVSVLGEATPTDDDEDDDGPSMGVSE